MFSFLNFHKDPNDRSRYVFYYKDPKTGDDFIKLCDEHNLNYKKLKSPENPDIIYVSFAKQDFDEAQRLNADAMGKNPKSFIPDKWFRIFTLSLFFIALAIALTGYVVTKLK